MSQFENLTLTKDQLHKINANRGKRLVEANKRLDGVVATPVIVDGRACWQNGYLRLSDVPPDLPSIEDCTLADLGLLDTGSLGYDTDGESGLTKGKKKQATSKPATVTKDLPDVDSENSPGAGS